MNKLKIHVDNAARVCFLVIQENLTKYKIRFKQKKSINLIKIH